MTKKKHKFTIYLFLIWFWIIGTSAYVVNEYYPLRDMLEELFPVHYKRYNEFGIKIPTQFKVHGIDVSRYQGRINWKMAKAMKDKDIGLEFAFIKATEGHSHKDSRFDYNWKYSKKSGFIRGAYHYFNPHIKGEIQAANFIRTVSLKKGDFPPVIDVEYKGNISAATLMKGVMKCAKKLEKQFGVKPIIYTYHDFYKQNFNSDFDSYILWIAHYYVKKPNNRFWNFWQHNDKGTVSGINTPVDFNVFNREMEQMKRLLIK